MSDPRSGALALVRHLRQAGYTAYWVGGCVRDHVLGRPPKDYDIATNARPEQVMAIFPDARPVGRSFGVVLAPDGEGNWVEVATFREDHGVLDGRHPRRVSFSDAQRDALRRDFTVNALFMDPETEKILDYVEGLRDLEWRVIRTVGEPCRRFEEDYLRMLRAVRFAATLQFSIEPSTFEAIQAAAGKISDISVDRIRNELTRLLLESALAGDAVDELDRSGLLAVMLPEVCAMHGVEQPPEFHPEGDVWTHTRIMLNALDGADPVLAWAAWLHDIGKPPTATEVDGRLRFDRHASVGAGMADAILRRLRFSNRDREAIVGAIRGHMRFADVLQMRPARLRRWMADPLFPLELALHRLDCLASHGKQDSRNHIEALRAEMERQPVLPPRWIRGADLLALGLTPGPRIGYWINEAYEAQLNGLVGDRDQLIAWLRDRIEATPPHAGAQHHPDL